jgi:hypothetical protein
MIFTEHHDAPVIPPKNMMVIDATVNRTTRSGDVLVRSKSQSLYCIKISHRLGCIPIL